MPLVKRMLKDQVQVLIQETRQRRAGPPQVAAVEPAVGNFVRHVSWMRGGNFRAAAGCSGSGGWVEAGCCKRCGVDWSEYGTNNSSPCVAFTAAVAWSELWELPA
jgi:hypothetical protein